MKQIGILASILVVLMASLVYTIPREAKLPLGAYITSFLIGVTGNFVIFGLSIIFPDKVRAILHRLILPVFWRAENKFPHERFFGILKEDAISVTKVDVFAHFHRHWLGISSEKEDTTGYHGTFYQKLFTHLESKSDPAHPIKLRILFLDYEKQSPEFIKAAARLLVIDQDSDLVPGSDPDERKLKVLKARNEGARERFASKIWPQIKSLIDRGILSSESAIGSADFVPTMGIIRLQYRGKTGQNTWIQAEVLTYAGQSREEGWFTIMLEHENALGLRDSRTEKFEAILESEWKRASIFKSV